MDTEGRAPLFSVLAPVAAMTAHVLLKRALGPVRHQLSREVMEEMDGFLRQTAMNGSWHEEWMTELRPGGASADGSAEALGAEAGAGSPQDEIDSEEAAMRLRLTPSRVRQLCRSGQLVARQVAGTWLIDAASVDVRRSEAA